MNQSKSLDRGFRILYPVLAIFFYLVSFACIFNTFDLALEQALFNLLLSLPLIGIMLMIFRRYHISVFAASIVAFVISYIDQFVYSVRLTHIRFSDIMQAGQAARVADRYKPIWTSDLTRCLIIVAALCAFLIFIAK